MIAFIKTPMQGVSLLSRKLCVHASISTHQNIFVLRVIGPSFHVLNESIHAFNESIHAFNEMIVDANDCLYDAKGKSVTDVLASLSSRSLSTFIKANKACAHDVQYVIKGVFYVPNHVSTSIKASSYVCKHAQNEIKTINKVIKAAFNVIKQASKGVKATYHACQMPLYVLKDVYYVIKEVIYGIKGNFYEAKEGSMMSKKVALKGIGTCNEAIMRGGFVGKGMAIVT